MSLIGAGNTKAPHPRILLVSSLFAPEVGGVCAVAEALAANLPGLVAVAAQTAVQTGVQTGDAGTDWKAYDRRFPFPVHRVERFETELPRWLPGRLRGPLQFASNMLWTRRRAGASLLRFLASHPVDVVCINTLGSYWVAGMLKRHYPAMKVVFYLHGEEVGGGAPRRIDGPRNRALRRADAVVAVSAYTRGLAMRRGVEGAKVHVVHNGVDTERFTPGAKDEAIMARFGLKGKKVLLCLARLDERKGQDMLLRAMPEILEAVPDAVLLLVGSGGDEARLRGLTAALALSRHVIFAGAATPSEVVAYYRTADVHAMPNRETPSGDTEGFGLVFLEAGACGKPVVGGRAGGVPDAVIDGETGYLVDGRSGAEVAAACVRLLAGAELAARLGRNGLSHSLQTTWKVQAERFLAVCESVCKAADEPPRGAR